MFSSQEIVRGFVCQSLLVFPPIFDLEIAWGTTKKSTKYTSIYTFHPCWKNWWWKWGQGWKKLLKFQSIQKDCKPQSLSLFLFLSLSLDQNKPANQYPTHEEWMVDGQKTLFYLVLVPYLTTVVSSVSIFSCLQANNALGPVIFYLRNFLFLSFWQKNKKVFEKII